MRFRMLASFFQSAIEYIKPDPDALENARESAPGHSSYHRRIVVISVVCGVIGLVAGIIGAIMMALDPPPNEDPIKMLLIFPLISCIVGLLLGTALACLFAPNDFLTGPVGVKWMRLIGTSNVTVARFVCFLFGVLLPTAVIVLIVFYPAKR